MKKIWSRLTNEEAYNSVLRVNPFFGHFADNSVYRDIVHEIKMEQ